MKKRTAVISTLFTLLSTLTLIGVYFSNLLMFMRKKEDSFIKEREIAAKRFIVKDFDALPKTNVKVRSPLNYDIDCLFVHPYPTNKWMIFCHGITENKYNSIKYMNLFLKRGFNAIIYDHRRHGASGGKTSSYGYYEKKDLEAVVDELKQRQGTDVIFGIHGESMGAVTTLLYAGSIRDDAAFYIADCPFSTMPEQVKYRVKHDTFFPPWLVMPIGKFFIKKRDGYSMNDVSPLAVINNIQKPVLFIHSIDDTYIPVAMTKQLYAAKRDKKQLFLAEKGAHAQSFNENQEEYDQAIDHFLKSFNLVSY